MSVASPQETAPSPHAAVQNVLAAVPAWWARRARRADLPPEWWQWRRALPAPPVELPSDGAELASASAHALGEAYACALGPSERIAHGRYYTPKSLADALWSEIERAGFEPPNTTIFDPAGGAGALLIRPLRRFVAEHRTSSATEALAEAAARFQGVDNDESAVWLGNAILAAELLPLWRRVPETERTPLPALLRVGSGLAVRRASAGTVVMNPPFGRAQLSADQRVLWSRSLFGHANWYGVFLHAAIERAVPNGIIGAVLPTSFLGGAYYQRLRGLLVEEAPLVRLRRIDDRAGVFAAGVLQETCLAVFQKGGTPGAVACSVQSVNGRARSARLGRATIDKAAGGPPWLLPRSSRDLSMIRAAARHRHRLRDYGWTASTGPLVWNRHKSQISDTRRAGDVSILWAADVKSGRISRSATRDNQRWIKLRTRDRFMLLANPAVLVQRTTAPEQPRRLVAAVLGVRTLAREWDGAVVVENHINVLRCDLRDSALTADLLGAILNTPTFDRLYRCMTGTVAVSAYELEALRLPGETTIETWAKLPRKDLARAVAETYS